MTANAQATASGPAPNAGMRSEIIARWSKFTESDVSALKNTDELVSQVQSKYSLDKTQAQKDVDAFAKGRSL